MTRAFPQSLRLLATVLVALLILFFGQVQAQENPSLKSATFSCVNEFIGGIRVYRMLARQVKNFGGEALKFCEEEFSAEPKLALTSMEGSIMPSQVIKVVHGDIACGMMNPTTSPMLFFASSFRKEDLDEESIAECFALMRHEVEQATKRPLRKL